MLKRTIKIVAVLIVSSIAVIGLLFDFKDQQGGLSEWGIGAIALTVLSAAAAIFIEYLEHQEEEQATQKVDEGEKLLKNIAKDVRNAEKPLLPITFLCCLEIPTSGFDFDGIEDANVYRADDFNLIQKAFPKDEEARIQIPGGYVDVREGTPVEAGVYFLKSNLRTAHGLSSRRFIRLFGSELREFLDKGVLDLELMHSPTSVEVDIALGDDSASLSLEAEPSASPEGIVVFDQSYFVWLAFEAKSVSASGERNWGFGDLAGSNLALRLGYFRIAGLPRNSLDDLSKIRMHDFQIITGERRNSKLQLPDALIAAQRWEKDQDFPVAEPSIKTDLKVAGNISEAMFEESAYFGA